MQSIAILVGLTPYMLDKFHGTYKLAREPKNKKCIELTFENYITIISGEIWKKQTSLKGFNFSYWIGLIVIIAMVTSFEVS